ncbi:MAG: helix-turn-helix domain-containing protein [Planctomycetota bacterium]
MTRLIETELIEGLKITEDEFCAVEDFVQSLRTQTSIDGLTAQETRFVRAVQSAGGRLVNQESLLGAISVPSSDEPNIRSVAVIACKVRAKRPDLGAQILTVWGQGFRWEEGVA